MVVRQKREVVSAGCQNADISVMSVKKNEIEKISEVIGLARTFEPRLNKCCKELLVNETKSNAAVKTVCKYTFIMRYWI